MVTLSVGTRKAGSWDSGRHCGRPASPVAPGPSSPSSQSSGSGTLWGSGWPLAGLTAPRLSTFHGLHGSPRSVAAVRVRCTLLWKSKTPDPRGPGLSPSQWQSQHPVGAACVLSKDIPESARLGSRAAGAALPRVGGVSESGQGLREWAGSPAANWGLPLTSTLFGPLSSRPVLSRQDKTTASPHALEKPAQCRQ